MNALTSPSKATRNNFDVSINHELRSIDLVYPAHGWTNNKPYRYLWGEGKQMIRDVSQRTWSNPYITAEIALAFIKVMESHVAIMVKKLEEK